MQLSSAMHETAIFGAGCFWGVEAAFRRLRGVVDTAVGYCGGTTQSPTYIQVCTGTTGHAEVVEVTFDPDRIPYTKLLQAFWQMHDPTQVNRQGPDVGSQYRSVIFATSKAQEEQARASRQAWQDSGAVHAPIATIIMPAPVFWRAEEYHQRYLEKNGGAACHI